MFIVLCSLALVFLFLCVLVRIKYAPNTTWGRFSSIQKQRKHLLEKISNLENKAGALGHDFELPQENDVTVGAGFMSKSGTKKKHVATSKKLEKVATVVSNVKEKTQTELPLLSASSFQFLNQNDTSLQDTKDTTMCHIPSLKPGDKLIYKMEDDQLLIKKIHPNCLKKKMLKFKMEVGSKLIRLNENDPFWKKVSCCYSNFSRKANTTEDWQMSFNKKCHPLANTTSQVIPSEHEYIKIDCIQGYRKAHVYTDYFATLPKKASVEEKAEAANDKTTPKLSIVIMGIDSCSHMNFLRWLPKTYEFLMKTMNATEFHALNTFGAGTLESVYPLLTGIHFSNLSKQYPDYAKKPLDQVPFLWKHLAKLGYRTSYQDGEKGMFPNGFLQQPVDYDLRLLTIFFHLYMRGHGYTSRQCFGDRLIHEYMLDNTYRLAHTLKDKLQFHMMWSESLSHDVNKVVNFADDPTLQFLQKMHHYNLLNNTAFLLISDHGMRYGMFRERTEQGYLEERLPFLFLVLPPWVRQKYRKAISNLENNARRLTSFLDMYKMLLDFTNLTQIEDSRIIERTTDVQENDDRKGVSLFLPIKKNRTCEDAGIPTLFCICLEKTPLNVSDPQLSSVTSFIIREMNKRLENYSQCHSLSFGEIISAQLLNPKRHMTIERQRFGAKNKHILNPARLDFQLKIKFTTEPGNALWEAICEYQSKTRNWVMGQIERINAYGIPKACVPNRSLREYCIC